jgi:hypothetical protein
MRELHRCSRLLAVDLAADKDARGIGRELDQGHARISTIEIFILAEKRIALAQILRGGIEDAPVFARHHLSTLPSRCHCATCSRIAVRIAPPFPEDP